jgi:hypothetical protein
MRSRVWTFIRLIWGEWASRVTGSLSAVLVLAGLGVSLAGTFGARIPSDSIIQLGTWLLAAICGGQAAYTVWKKENDEKHKIEAECNSLKDRLVPKIGIAVNANGVVEEKDRNGMLLAKRVQIIVRSRTDTPLIGCQTEIERVECLNADGSIMILNEPLRVEWGNVDEREKFGKITIPAGAEKRVNLFVISCVSTGRLE